MSKWKLLQTSMAHGLDPARLSSIHSHASLFTFHIHPISKKKLVWKGFLISLSWSFFISNEYNTIIQKLLDYVEAIDCAEYYIKVIDMPKDHDSKSFHDLEQHISNDQIKIELVENNHWKQSSQDIILRFICSNYTPTMPQCLYHSIHCTSLGDTVIYTREAPSKRKISANDLLSNQLHNIDNTGNICVWPCEYLLSSVILSTATLRNAVTNKDVLELGGGMTAFAGLLLAASGLPSRVTISDGHPTCVRNQVRNR
jgi:hypothetical protein